MKKLNFEQQIKLSLGIMILSFIISGVTKIGLFHNVAWILYGLLWIYHPVWPKSWGWRDPKDLTRGIRIAGALCILIGLITRFGA